MRTTAVFFLVISELAMGVTSNDDHSTIDSDVACRARAWVRAPDLEPGQIVQGHVKVKLDGSCDDVSSYVLGLRFAERSWVKTRREDATLPMNPRKDPALLRSQTRQKSDLNDSVYENPAIGWNRWNLFQDPEGGQSVWDQYESEMKNPSLWLVREEERVAFETKFRLSDETQKPSRGIVKPFSLLVPSTNYPPAFDTSTSGGSVPDADDAGVEHIYQYFVDVTFSNGTSREIEAGYTSFKTITTPVQVPGPETVNVTAARNSMPCNTLGGSECEAEDNIARDKFTLEITFPDGRHLEQGSINNITIRSHQLGPGVQRPLSVQALFAHATQKRRWAAKHAADSKTAEVLLNIGMMYSTELQPKVDDKYIPHWQNLVLPQFSQDGAIENDTIFSTEPVTAQFQVPPRAYPPFDMYYQTLDLDLGVNIAIRNVSETGLRHGPKPDEEEYDWIPTLSGEEIYQNQEIIRAKVPIFVYRKPRTTLPRVVHYLSPEARSPIFVDPSSVAQLLQMAPEVRDRLAPISQARFTAHADGEVVKNRYFSKRGSRGRGQYYVGNTWLRKVVARGEDKKTTQEEGTLVIQA